MSEKQSKDLTFGDLFGMIFRHKKILIIVTLVIAIMGTILFSALMGNQKYYSSIFSIEYPNSQTQTLPDGTKFKFTEIISSSALKEAKKCSPAFDSLNVDKMIESNDVSISFDTAKINDKNETYYKVNIKATYFQDRKQAKVFFTELASLTIENVKDMVASKKHDVYLNAFTDAADYEDKINFLNAQKSYILGAYDQSVSLFGDVLIDGKTLQNYNQEIVNYFTINSIDALSGEVAIKGYAEKDALLSQEYKMEVQKLTEEKAVNNQAIGDLKEQLADFHRTYPNLSSETLFNDIYEHIASLVTRNAKIDQEISSLNKKIAYTEGNVPSEDATSYATFKQNLNKYYEKLSEFTKTYAKNVNSVYDKLSSVSFYDPAIVTVENNFSMITSFGISLLCGLIVASVSCVLYDQKEQKKKVKEEQK